MGHHDLNLDRARDTGATRERRVGAHADRLEGASRALEVGHRLLEASRRSAERVARVADAVQVSERFR